MRADLINIPALLAFCGIQGGIRGNELWARCPHHKEQNPSWHININPNDSRYGLHYCFSCSFGGNLQHLIAFLRKQFPGRVDAVLSNQGVYLISSKNLIGSKKRLSKELKLVPIQQSPETARRYLELRGISIDDAVRYELLWCLAGALKDRIVFEVYPEGWVGRTVYENVEPRYLHTKGSRGVVIIGYPSAGVVAFTEGAFDALKIALAGYPAVALLSKNWVSKLTYIESYIYAHRIHTALCILDEDAHVENRRLLYYLNMICTRSFIVPVNGDAGAMNPKELRYIIDCVMSGNDGLQYNEE